MASVQLKWLRRAQEDYEYLMLAEERGMRTNAFLLARLLAGQVELQAAQAPDPEYGLLSGTVDQKTWDEAHDSAGAVNPGAAAGVVAGRSHGQGEGAGVGPGHRPLAVSEGAAVRFTADGAVDVG